MKTEVGRKRRMDSEFTSRGEAAMVAAMLGIALVEGDREAAIGVCGRRVPVDVVLSLEGVAVFAGSAKVKVIGLTLGEVVVERSASQRR